MNIKRRIKNLEDKIVSIDEKKGFSCEFTKFEVDFLEKAEAAFKETFPGGFKNVQGLLDPDTGKKDLPQTLSAWIDNMAEKTGHKIDIDLQRRGWIHAHNAGHIVGFLATRPYAREVLQDYRNVPYLGYLVKQALRE